MLYASTKGAVDKMTMAFAKELAPRNIRVNTVTQGTDTKATLVTSPARQEGLLLRLAAGCPVREIPTDSDAA